MVTEKVIYEVIRDWGGSGNYSVEGRRDSRDYEWIARGRYETEGEARARANWLVQEDNFYAARVGVSVESECPFEHAHTKHFCGYEGCRES